MADLHIRGPRRASGLVEMHPADLVRYFDTPQCMTDFTTEELRQIYSSINAELTFRESDQPPARRNDADHNA